MIEINEEETLMSNKMKFETSNLTAENVAKIAELFPGVVTEGKVNLDLLRTMLGEEVYGDEAYEFTWVGKRAAIAEAGKPIRKTLRPCPEESKDWDITKNLYIEGDNLDVLKLLQESYLGKVKMVYIDPPYNTGNDFIYRDDFSKNRDAYDVEAGVYDEEGSRLFKNTESNGRFHSDWCSMIYPRLVLARNLLRDDGVIFISIDDGEVAQLRKICDEVFGESNFVASIVWERAYSPVNLKKHFSESHDYIVCYANNITNLTCNGLSRSEDANNRYSNPDNDARGVWKSSDLSVGPAIASNIYEIITPSGRKVMPPSGYSWRLNKERFQEFVSDNRIWFGTNGENVPSIKRFLSEVKQGITPMTIWKYQEVGHSQKASQDLKKIFDDNAVFTYPKPVELIKRLLELYTNDDSIVLDFFSGSATTAHAVIQLNSEDSGKRNFILVQLPEETEETSIAYKAGFKNICEIGKERIQRVGNKIKDEAGLTGQGLDIGFRVLKLDDTNMNDVYYAAGDYTQDMISMLQSNIKEDRTDMDLLFGCLLDWGLPLSLPHTHEKIDGFTVHTYNEGDLIACFEERISEHVVREIAKRQPLRVVFRDSSFTSSPEKINVVEIFKLLAPNTTVRVI
jgi:adenine-specific DNA-methyltransferase